MLTFTSHWAQALSLAYLKNANNKRMYLTKDETKEPIVASQLPQDVLKGLCFNCDHRKRCTWKENRKVFCENFK